MAFARSAGAAFIIAVDVMSYPSEMPEDLHDYPELMMSDCYRCAISLRDLPAADIVISPRPGYYSGFSVEERARLIGIGYSAGKAALPEIEKQLRQRGFSPTRMLQ